MEKRSSNPVRPRAPTSWIARSTRLGEPIVIPKSPRVPKVDPEPHPRRRSVRPLPPITPPPRFSSTRPLPVLEEEPPTLRRPSAETSPSLPPPTVSSVPDARLPAPPAAASLSSHPATSSRAGRVLSAVTIPIALAVVVATALAARSHPAPAVHPEDAKSAPAASIPATSLAAERPSPPEAPPFDRDAALTAIRGAESRATWCKRGRDPTPAVEAFVTFAPDGQVLRARIAGELEGTSVGGCLLKVLRTATVPPFSGDAVTVKRRIVLP